PAFYQTILQRRGSQLQARTTYLRSILNVWYVFCSKKKSTYDLTDILLTDGRRTMYEMRIVKLFKNGADQTVRLPAEFSFDGDEVYIRRDDPTGDVVLSSRPGEKIWSDFFDFMRSIDVPADFMAERPMNVPPQTRILFDSEDV